MISPGLCLFCLNNEGLPAAQRLRQWTRNCALINHVEKYIESVPSWPTSCVCDTETKDATSLRYYLSDTHSLRKAEWTRFDVKGLSEKDEDLINTAPTPNLKDIDETRPRKERKFAKTGDKFIQCSSFSKSGSQDPPVPRLILPDRAKISNSGKLSRKKAPTGWIFIE